MKQMTETYSYLDSKFKNQISIMVIFVLFCFVFCQRNNWKFQSGYFRQISIWMTEMFLFFVTNFLNFYQVLILLPLVPGPLWSAVVVPVNIASMAQINMFKNHSYSIGLSAK